jgi:hypothetical protein
MVKCNACLEEKEEYLTGICKECADAMDEIRGNKDGH